eukprot:TRINITY_DN606_c0_g1_i1.p1 TRINITY_DN606_c0_g1~~TRINITY_DN606_c0_g1_i1.p1  ORF type:complete len:465 (+),score=109.05 TRINITY_DN606_c0_g1_i1:104-1498(+)
MADSRPDNIGIVAADIYFPKTYVNQEELEAFDNIPKGKYTIGLGQDNMAYVGDREDIVSISLTVVQNLMEKFQISYKDIGRLEVGTETLIDKSKSVKTNLLRLFAESGNTNIEGVDNINACYGGTAALFNCIHWMESSYWDGRYALVVAGDIAVYAAGAARPTGGCGAVAMLIGPNAPLVFERGLRHTHMDHAYDFYKPDLKSEYPYVDGLLSINCYLGALDACYNGLVDKLEKKEQRKVSMDDFDYFVFHAPYNKLVQKSYARLFYNDFKRQPDKAELSSLQAFSGLERVESYGSRELEKATLGLAGDRQSRNAFESKVQPSCLLPKNLGNTYTGSVYSGLLSLLALRGGDVEGEADKELVGKRIALFSYGSGLASSIFVLRVAASVAPIVAKIAIPQRLAKRTRAPPSAFVDALRLREERYLAGSYVPSDPVDAMWPGTYFLTQVDEKRRRFYDRTPLDATQ